MATSRNYQAEYQRRIASAAKRGLSRSQARGHAKASEASLRVGSSRDHDRLTAAFQEMRRAGSQTAAAKAFNIAPERLRKFVREHQLAERHGRTWKISGELKTGMLVTSEGAQKSVVFVGPDQVSINGRHQYAIKAFLSANDRELLRPFEGQSVIDAKGKSRLLETDPNVLFRLAAAGSEVFHEIYRLIH